MAVPVPERDQPDPAFIARAIETVCQKGWLNAEFARRSLERKERREQRRGAPQPTSGLYAALQAGETRRKRAPRGGPRGRAKSMLEDRELVPAAMRHWRKVHGLSIRQAQARIGYSVNSCSWRHWEDGHVAPPYRTLLLIIAATGLGYWIDEGPTLGDPGLDLEAAAAQHRSQLDQRRTDRLARRGTPPLRA